MEWDDVQAYWEKDWLVKWPASDVERLTLPTSSKQFLTTVGLPRSVRGFSLEFYPHSSVSGSISNREELLVIGSDTGVPICLDLSRNGIVISLEDACASGARFVNSAVEHLGFYLVMFDRYLDDVGELIGELAIRDYIGQIEAAMRIQDSQAFSDADSFWSSVIEQMRNGDL